MAQCGADRRWILSCYYSPGMLQSRTLRCMWTSQWPFELSLWGIYCWVTNHRKISILKIATNIYYLIRSFCWPGIGVWLSWVILVQYVPLDFNHLSSDQGCKFHFQSVWGMVSTLCSWLCRPLFTGMHECALKWWPRLSEIRDSKMKALVSFVSSLSFQQHPLGWIC